MVTMAQRIEALRTQKAMSRPALAAALGLPRMSVEKFETGRQTPTQDQQTKLAHYFGVSLSYLRGETDDPTSMDSWLSGAVPDGEPVRPAPRPLASKVIQSSGGKEDGAVFSTLLKSKSFQDMVRSTVLEVLRSPEGQALLAKAVKKELDR
ncbi:helix-turn-helix domain-containing protein [uncultured Dysosmobacter sp.]|uniref:helix-turn-helix domain-containing protein n=1 Tax=uncultured Dysosmobacter sp. TaxID=2591384 RepID=UPI0026216D98|nr:helix-turn-helix domain-containing protein [uncultured Dysosmobacter sp.]